MRTVVTPISAAYKIRAACYILVPSRLSRLSPIPSCKTPASKAGEGEESGCGGQGDDDCGALGWGAPVEMVVVLVWWC